MRSILAATLGLALSAPVFAQDNDAAAPAAQAPAAAPARPKTHTVVKGDCLWELAKTYYSNPYRWKVIYAANRDKIKDPHWIYPGQVFSLEEVPGPEIGEVGARPVETGAAVTVPQAAPAPAPEPPAEAPAPAAEVPNPKAQPPASDDEIGDDIRTKLPPGMTGLYPSLKRSIMPSGWEADGKVLQLDEGKIAAAEGDSVSGKLGKMVPAAAGDRFSVFRKDSPMEGDEDKNATYLQRVATVEVRRSLGKYRYSFKVLSSADTVQPGDLLKAEAR